MIKHNRFKQGQSTFKCMTCERRTRNTGQSTNHLCEDCEEIAGLDNMVNDSGEACPTNVLLECNSRLANIARLGGNFENVKAANTYIWNEQTSGEQQMTKSPAQEATSAVLRDTRSPSKAKAFIESFKSKATPAQQVAKCGMEVPAFLKRKKGDVKDETPMPKSVAVVVKAESDRAADMPKGFEGTREEFEAMKRALDPREAKREAKKEEFFEKAKKQHTPKGPAPAGTFKLAAWATENKLDPRLVRRAARTIKTDLAKLYVGGMKYVFADASKAEVARLIRDAQAKETKRTVRVGGTTRKVKTPRIPPAAEGSVTWSGKAAKVKAANAPKPVDPKGAARKVAKEAVKTLKRAVKDAKGNKEKAVKVLKKAAVKAAKKSSKK